MQRALNFSAGPSALPVEVLQIAQEELLDFRGSGISVMEGSHRAKLFDDVYQEAVKNITNIYKIPNNFKILFMQGGASMQFAMVPMNLRQKGIVEFIDTGVWSTKAIKEANIQGLDARVIASSKESNYDHIPKSIIFNDDIDYGYITSNNTIYGTQYKTFPTCKTLVIDASSDIFSYPIEWSKVGILFAGAQKNAGPSGVTIVIIREDLLERASQKVPSMLKYINYANNDSMFNTPPTFSIYLLNLVMEWLNKQGGVEGIEKINTQKASLLYDIIDKSEGFYKGYAQKESRSNMNISFFLEDKNLEKTFLEESIKRGMIGLKGHRALGGIRASIYNAIDLKTVQALGEFMTNFQSKYS